MTAHAIAASAVAQTPWQNQLLAQPYIRPLPELIPAPAAEPAPAATMPIPAPAGPLLVEPLLTETPPEPLPKIWTGAFELGLTGTQGNSRTANFRFGVDLESDIPGSKIDVNLDYKRDNANGVATANQLFLEGRHGWSRKKSPREIFLHGSVEYNEFRPYDARIAMDGGLSYSIIKNEITKLKGRAGVGLSRKVGGPNDQVIPEALFGADLSRKISSRQKLKASSDFYPSFEDRTGFRITTRIDWEFLLDAESNLSLKFGLVDRYDSRPGGGKKNEFDYSSVILWKF